MSDKIQVNKKLSELSLYFPLNEYSIIVKIPWYEPKTKEYSWKNLKITLESNNHSQKQIYYYILNCLNNDKPIDFAEMGVDVFSIAELNNEEGDYI